MDSDAIIRARANALLLSLLLILLAMWLLPVRAAAASLQVSLACEVRDTSWVRDAELDHCLRALPRSPAPATHNFFYYWNEMERCGNQVVAGPSPALVLSFQAKGTPAAQHPRRLLGWFGFSTTPAGR